MGYEMRVEHTVHYELKQKYEKLLSFMKSLASTECWSSLEIVENRAKEILKEIGESE